jgi:hypothetical protein
LFTTLHGSTAQKTTIWTMASELTTSELFSLNMMPIISRLKKGIIVPLTNETRYVESMWGLILNTRLPSIFEDVSSQI